MAWRVAKSLLELLDEINRRSPDRSKLSDGFLGNAAHQSRDSDHNPWVQDGVVGVVTAGDFTNDPDDGFDSSDFANWLRERCRAGDETRVKYVISDRRIASASTKPGHKHWDWRPYDGPNAHLHHVHVSVRSEKSNYDDTSPWGWEEDDMALTEQQTIDAVIKALKVDFIPNEEPGTGKNLGNFSVADALRLGDRKADEARAADKAELKRDAGLKGTVDTLSAAVQALAANSPDGVRRAFAEGVASLQAELAGIDVHVTLVPGDDTPAA